jgi:RimJ/RimL family protein N-acetyltransferase
LRPWRDSDLRSIVDACQDPEISRWTRVPSPYGETDARLYLLQRHDAVATAAMAPFAIVSAVNDEQLLGSISLMSIDWRNARAEVGYWLAADARGRGHATRSVRLISGWGFQSLGLERLELHVATENLTSQAVAERAGFTREAVFRSYFQAKQGRQDMIVYGLLSAEAAAPAARARSLAIRRSS